MFVVGLDDDDIGERVGAGNLLLLVDVQPFGYSHDRSHDAALLRFLQQPGDARLRDMESIADLALLEPGLEVEP